MTGSNAVRGELPRTVHGQPSYSLAKSLITQGLAETLAVMQGLYGLTDLEMAEVVGDIARAYVHDARVAQQKRNPARKGALGTPRWEEYERTGQS